MQTKLSVVECFLIRCPSVTVLCHSKITRKLYLDTTLSDFLALTSGMFSVCSGPQAVNGQFPQLMFAVRTKATVCVTAQKG